MKVAAEQETAVCQKTPVLLLCKIPRWPQAVTEDVDNLFLIFLNVNEFVAESWFGGN